MRPWTDITYEELMSMIDSKDVQLFDVRRVDEVESTGLIPGAVNIASKYPPFYTMFSIVHYL